MINKYLAGRQKSGRVTALRAAAVYCQGTVNKGFSPSIYHGLLLSLGVDVHGYSQGPVEKPKYQ